MTPRRQYRDEFSLTHEMRTLVQNMMRRDGRDFSKCEMCGGEIKEGKAELHHTKYKGATYYDLLIVCHKCNTQPENRGLL